MALHCSVRGTPQLDDLFSQAEIGLGPFTPQMDAHRPVLVSSTNSTIAMGNKTHCGSDYVNNNPGAFSNAYFEFNALNIYT